MLHRNHVDAHIFYANPLIGYANAS